MLTPILLLSLLASPQGLVLQQGTRRPPILLRQIEGGQSVESGPSPQSGQHGGLVLLAPQEQGDRAWIGVQIDTGPVSDRPGLGIASVVQGSPADRAGLEAGDRVLALGGRPVGSYDELIERLGELRPGQQTRLTVQHALAVPLDERGYDGNGPRLGAMLRPGEDGAAVVVDSVEQGWPAAAAGLRAGDRIVRANGQAIDSDRSLRDAVAAVEPGSELRLVVQRRVSLTLGSFPEEQGERSEGLEEPGEGPSQLGPGLQQVPPREAPQGGWLFTPQPQPAPEVVPQGRELSQLRNDVRSLTHELLALRDELRQLREELQALRSERVR